jgi:hypothetical protein
MAEQRNDALADPLGPSTAKAPRRWWARWPVLLILGWVALAVVDLSVFGVSSSAPRAAATKTGSTVHVRSSAPSQVATPAPARSSAPPSPAPAVQVLVPAGASAFGPTGPASGDNPDDAGLAIDASMATAWQTDWYRSAVFGNLQAGTGLLIDMGRPVSITSVQLLLGAPGADLELLTGDTPALSQLHVQATANDAGGSVTLNLANSGPASYLLIWFTVLPPDSSGTFQASVYNVRIEGTP